MKTRRIKINNHQANLEQILCFKTLSEIKNRLKWPVFTLLLRKIEAFLRLSGYATAQGNQKRLHRYRISIPEMWYTFFSALRFLYTINAFYDILWEPAGKN